MRRSYLAVVALLFGCTSSHREAHTNDAEGDDACANARKVHEDALAEAIGLAPPCERDDDCIVMVERASCEGLLSISLCELSVHRDVPALYDAPAVSDRMCEVMADSPYGCDITAACREHGPPVCRAGVCTFADP